jgi:hypothetical protein
MVVDNGLAVQKGRRLQRTQGHMLVGEHMEMKDVRLVKDVRQLVQTCGVQPGDMQVLLVKMVVAQLGGDQPTDVPRMAMQGVAHQ